MAGLAFGVLGAALAPAGFASWGWMIGSTLGNLLFPQSQPDVRNEGPRLADLEVQSSDYGRALPVIFGSMVVGGNLVWSKKLREVVETTTTEQGGKGGPSQTVTTVTYRYFADFALALCDCTQQPIAGVPRIWVNGELSYDKRPGSANATAIATAEFEKIMRVYDGSPTAPVDPLMEADVGVGRTPAFRRTAGLVFEGYEVTKWGTIPQFKVEVMADGSSGPLISYFLGGITSTSQHGFVGYSPDQGEVWVDDPAYGSGSSPDRFGVYNLAAASWSSVLLQSPWVEAATGNGPRGGIMVPEWDVMYATARDPNSPFFKNALIYSLATQAYLGNFKDLIDDGETTEHTVIGVDTKNGTILVFSWGTGLSIWTVRDGLPFEKLATFATASPGDHVKAIVDAEDNFWLKYGGSAQFWKINGAAQTVIATDADGCSSKAVEYDPTRNCFYYWSDLGASEYLKKLDCDTGAMSRVNAVAYPNSGNFPQYGVLKYAPDIDRVIAFKSSVSAVECYVINPTDGAIEATYDVSQGGVGAGTGLASIAYAPGVVWYPASSTGIGELRFDALSESGPTLASVVTRICASVGLTAGQIDVTQLASDIVAGYAVPRVGPARQALEPLMLAYQFDAVESDGKIKFVKRGGAVAEVLGPHDLITHMEGEEWKAPVDVTQRLETEKPIEVRVTCADYAMDYVENMQFDKRQVGEAVEVQNIALPMRLTPAQCKRVATMVLYGQAVASEGLEFSTSNRWLHLEPTDVVQVQDGNALYTVRMEGKNEARSRVRWRAPIEDIAVYSQNAVGAAGPAPVSVVRAIGNTLLRLLDIPLLREQDDNIGIYVAVCGLFEGWRGCEIWESSDGVTYSSTGLKLNTPTATGFATNALQDFAQGNTLDVCSYLDVVLIPGSGSLSSGTDQEFYGGLRAALVGDEVLLYRDATLTAPDAYRLTTFLRYRAGTEGATHVAGDRFVALSTASLRRLNLAAGAVGTTKYFKAVSVGLTPAQTAATTIAFANIGKRPLPPVDVNAAKDDAGNFIINWTPCSRLASGWNDNVDVPDDGTTYELEIYSSGFGTLKRTVTGIDAATYTYTTADQTTDFGSTQTTIYYRLYPTSTAFGRGPYVQRSSL